MRQKSCGGSCCEHQCPGLTFITSEFMFHHSLHFCEFYHFIILLFPLCFCFCPPPTPTSTLSHCDCCLCCKSRSESPPDGVLWMEPDNCTVPYTCPACQKLEADDLQLHGPLQPPALLQNTQLQQPTVRAHFETLIT